MSLLSYSKVFSRQKCLNSNNERLNSDNRFKNLCAQLENVRDGRTTLSINSYLENYVDSMRNVENASENYTQPLQLLQLMNEKEASIIASHFLHEYLSHIIFYNENADYVPDVINEYALTDDQKSRILEAVDNIHIADRIINNFNILKEKGMEIKNPYLLSNIVEEVCSYINKFNISTYQKYSLALEESWYVCSGKINNPNALSKYIAEYFSLNSDITNRDFKGFNKVNKSCVLFEVLDPVYTEISEINSIAKWISCVVFVENKETDVYIKDTFETLMDNISDIDIMKNIVCIFETLYKLYKSSKVLNTDDSDYPDWYIDDIMNNLLRRIKNYDRDNLISINSRISNYIDSIFIDSSISNEDKMRVIHFKKLIREAFIEKLDDYVRLIYSKDNIDNINRIAESTDYIPLEEFKLFKFNNLIKATYNLNKYLKEKENNVFNKYYSKFKNKVKKVKNILFPENANIYDYINEAGVFTNTLIQYVYEDESIMMELQDMLNEIANDINQRIYNEGYKDIRAYYMINPGVAEINLGYTGKIALEDSDINIISQSLDEEAFDIYSNNIFEAIHYSYLFEKSNIKSIMDSLEEAEKGLSREEMQLALEALNIAGIDDEFTMNFINEAFNYNGSVDDYPLSVRLEAFEAFQAIMEKGAAKVEKPEVGPKKNDEEDEDDVEAKKNKFSGINFGKIKLMLLGAKKLAGKVNRKGQEIFKNLDYNSTRFVKSLKKAMVSDRREAIIKGSIIPSFSKCIQAGMALAGTYVISGFNPVVPLAVAIGGFAISKNLTKKERILLLDEIEIELEVIDKEIQLAESNNKLKRLRMLMRQKKELQRQYQRIKYNIRVGKDILPGSSVGVPSNND